MFKDLNFVFRKEMEPTLYDSTLVKTQNLLKSRIVKMEKDKRDACKSAI